MSFWTDLADAVRRWRPSLGGYINTGSEKMIVPVLRGEQLDLVAIDAFILEIVDHEDVRAFIAQQAAALLRRPVRVRFTLRDPQKDKTDPIQKLRDNLVKFPDLAHIQE